MQHKLQNTSGWPSLGRHRGASLDLHACSPPFQRSIHHRVQNLACHALLCISDWRTMLAETRPEVSVQHATAGTVAWLLTLPM